MKRYFYVVLLLFAAAVFSTGCGEQSQVAQGTAEAYMEIEHIDVDLTQLGPMIISAQVSRMLMEPDKYLGQTVRVKGSYFSFFWNEGNMRLHYVVLDLTVGCCGQGFEIILSDNIISNQGYPPENSVIEVTGTFSSYEKLGRTFYYLAVFEIIIH